MIKTIVRLFIGFFVLMFLYLSVGCYLKMPQPGGLSMTLPNKSTAVIYPGQTQ